MRLRVGLQAAIQQRQVARRSRSSTRSSSAPFGGYSFLRMRYGVGPASTVDCAARVAPAPAAAFSSVLQPLCVDKASRHGNRSVYGSSRSAWQAKRCEVFRRFMVPKRHTTARAG